MTNNVSSSKSSSFTILDLIILVSLTGVVLQLAQPLLWFIGGFVAGIWPLVPLVLVLALAIGIMKTKPVAPEERHSDL